MHESIYRGLIAHGLFIVTLIPGLLPSERFVISPYTHRIVRGIEHLRILAPVYPGDTVRVRTRLKRVVPAQSGKGVILSRDVECWTQANVKPVVVCTLLLQYF
jgi:acyl dehydratase